MARVIAELRAEIDRPYGVNVLWDPAASIDVAVATGASFVREIFSGVYASDYGLWDTNCGAIIRHQHAVGGAHIKLLFNIVPESAVYLSNRNVVDIAKSTVFRGAAGRALRQRLDRRRRDLGGDAAAGQSGRAGYACLRQYRRRRRTTWLTRWPSPMARSPAPAFKRDGRIWNEVDVERVRDFMRIARRVRGD